MPFSGSESGKYALFVLCEELCVIILNERHFGRFNCYSVRYSIIWSDFCERFERFNELDVNAANNVQYYSK